MTTMAAALRECSLEELRKEPWRLQIQAENAAEQLRNLVLKNYHLFIQSNQCSAIVKDDLLALRTEANAVVDFIPDLKAYCASFQDEIASVVAKHGDVQFVFEHYVQLTELLDIPQLLEACVHNELFDEALDVIQFAHETFETRDGHAPPNFVIAALVREVAQLTQRMRVQLLQKLREDLPLALCVRIVSYVRRLDSLVAQASTSTSVSTGTPEYERQLKDEFLRCRNVWLASLSRSVAAAEPYQYTMQLIDIKRTSWFDMITQYSAIFGNETVDGKVDPPLCRWATTTVADFLEILMKQLPKIEDLSSLATVFEQSLFFGGSLGRVGVDFRAILVVAFEDHVFGLVTHQWCTATREFDESLSAHALAPSSAAPNGVATAASLAKTPLVLASYRATTAGAAAGAPFASRASSAAASGEDYAPPHALMAFPIVAEFTNAVLTSLNELRLCTIASLQVRLAAALFETLAHVLRSLARFCDENKLDVGAADATKPAHGTPTSRRHALTESLERTIQIVRQELVPYVVRCFHRLYPHASVSAHVLDVRAFDDVLLELGLLRVITGAVEEPSA